MTAQSTSLPPAGTRRERARATRVLGYTIAVVVNSVLLYLVNVAPGWGEVPFVRDSAAEVVPALNVALTVAIIGNIVNVVFDRRWVRAITEILSSAASLVFVVATLRVFPFAFGSVTVDWALITRIVLVFAAIGCVISLVVQLFVLVAEGRRRLAAGRHL